MKFILIQQQRREEIEGESLDHAILKAKEIFNIPKNCRVVPFSNGANINWKKKGVNYWVLIEKS